MNNTSHTKNSIFLSGQRQVNYSKHSNGASNFTPRQALNYFVKQKIDDRMIRHLVKMTEKIINVQEPSKSEILGGFHSLYDFIKALVKGSNVQTPTLMSTTIYLRRLNKILPSNVIGIATTRHRMFVGCLIITSKNLNDSSPLNKHWKNYCLDMLSLKELNTIEREILELFNWKLEFDDSELIESLGELLMPQNNTYALNSDTPSNSYSSAYSTVSSNSIFSNTQKTMTSSSRMSNLSSLTDNDYEQYYSKQQNTNYSNSQGFYKHNASRSDVSIAKEKLPNAVFKHNPTPPIHFDNHSEGNNILKNHQMNNSDSLLNVSRLLNKREEQRLLSKRSVSSSNLPEDNHIYDNEQNYRIQHPHYQMEYL
ncbi:hypothetical protein QEN19_003052 [Hanseniaspora menglaensis]